MGRILYSICYNVELTLAAAVSLCRKWSRAKDGIANTQPAPEQPTDCLKPSLVQEWTAQHRIAMENCGDHLKIYEVKSEKRGRLICFTV